MSLEQNSEGSQDENSQFREPKEEPRTIEIGSKDDEILNASITESGEVVEQMLDAKGREALEILFKSPFEKEFTTDRTSFLAPFIYSLQKCEKNKPEDIDEKIEKSKAILADFHKTLSSLEENIGKWEKYPDMEDHFKSSVEEYKEKINAREAFIQALEVIKSERES